MGQNGPEQVDLQAVEAVKLVKLVHATQHQTNTKTMREKRLVRSAACMACYGPNVAQVCFLFCRLVRRAEDMLKNQFPTERERERGREIERERGRFR